MNTISYSNNPVLKIGSNLFTDIRLQDKSKFYSGASLDILYRAKSLGSATIITGQNFKLSDLPECLCQLSFGKNQQAVKTMLYRFYPGITEETLFSFLVIEWQHRNIQYQEVLLQEWWLQQREAQGASRQSALWP